MRSPDMPPPAPFMWACHRCADLLIDLATASELTLEHDLYDGAARVQLMLSGHLANEHAGEIPEPHEDCPRCTYYEKWADQQGMHDLWREHRARDLFLPTAIARRM